MLATVSNQVDDRSAMDSSATDQAIVQIMHGLSPLKLDVAIQEFQIDRVIAETFEEEDGTSTVSLGVERLEARG